MAALEAENVSVVSFSASILLLTTALLLFHMTRSGTLLMPFWLAAASCCALIGLNIYLTVYTCWTYADRTSGSRADASERSHRAAYLTWGILWTVLQVVLAGVVVRDAVVRP